jgi:hypothetical protein
MKKLLHLILLASIIGCGTHKYNAVYSPSPLSFNSTRIDESDKLSLFVNSITGYNKDGAISLNDSFTTRLINELRAFRIFEQVLYNSNVGSVENPITVDIKITEEYNNKYAENYFKGFFIGLSGFLITPFVNLKSDYSLEYVLTFYRGDDERVITTKCSKEKLMKLFSDEDDDSMISKVRAELNKDLESQLRSELSFYTNMQDK